VNAGTYSWLTICYILAFAVEQSRLSVITQTAFLLKSVQAISKIGVFSADSGLRPFFMVPIVNELNCE